MCKKQDTLARLLAEAGGAVAAPTMDLPSSEDITPDVKLEMHRVYEQLGGIRSAFVVAPGPWDLQVGDIIVELDEEAHFNQYRGVTLESPLYQRLPGFPLSEYREYCTTRESRCLARAGFRGFWTSDGSEAQFGEAGREKDLSGKGAPRWKQRAFNDFVKDLAPLVLGIQVARIAVWDVLTIGGRHRTVRYVLRKEPEGAAHALMELVMSRAGRHQ